MDSNVLVVCVELLEGAQSQVRVPIPQRNRHLKI